MWFLGLSIQCLCKRSVRVTVVFDVTFHQDVGMTKAPCMRAGICLCTGDGPTLAKLATRLLGEMKRKFPRNTAERTLWRDGCLAVRLLGQPADSLDAEA